MTGIEAVREQLARLPRRSIAGWMIGTGLLPYLVYSLLSGTFAFAPFLVLAALVTVVSCWYLVLPAQAWSDLLFLMLMASVILARSVIGHGLAEVYVSTMPRIRLDILGVVMWMRIGILAVLLLRPLNGVNFGFVPSRREWWVGLQSFLFFAPLGFLLNLEVEFAKYRVLADDWSRVLLVAITVFAGMFFVQTVAEEFFFRGMLLQLLNRWWRNATAALIVSSVVFGLAHLPYRSFPNWRFVLLATLAGLFYGLSYLRTGSIRASMVTHALVNTAWKVFFTA